METVPHAAGLAVAHIPFGARGVFVIDATGAAFIAAEQEAVERLHLLRRLLPHLNIDLVCIPAVEAETIETAPDLRMEVYRYGGM